MTDPQSVFAGTWTLRKWTALKNGEPAGYPMGEKARGQIIYSGDGHMCAFLMRADFPGQTENGTPDTCISYGGSWRYEDGKVIHEVAFSNLPHWVGRTLVRLVDRQDGTIILSTEPEYSKSGSRYEHQLVWEKV